ncbi:dephospho-CoA kinase [Flavobacterium sp. CYK-4]|uniref:dephospho-CoA kinase n=1 Tax=Flavobacterium lotistagni TaxID=2709660 RepID=UPI00140E2FF7|nr:dephospho-CoA kinase [Flavobacterium lotistagni]NHM06965.1 dephospho-CoA kinase [Flavobacterium lotistagni]
MTKIIGLTGGIGSGKTTIAKHFKSLGIPVYIADDEAKKIIDEASIQQQIVKTFGVELVDNKIDRKQLANLVFSNPEKLSLLNEIVHPAVKAHFESWLSSQQNCPIIIKEAAILFESGSYKDCDKIITVIAPLESRIERVLLRDQTSREAILSRINNQWTDPMRIAKSDYVIENRELTSAKIQAEEILKKLQNP